ncbi:bifunctional pyr operon transcriptional regulator/uracil phosphoribosyltransferase PyrR [Gottschalkiaceae bacterium SANA]|jgi:pyrimidine operon attenuation protein/uracil phosphoribosyltransferase|nr:bifunctional pyr operon transcriptional regulator/uracil phosphoribosyltransferase PyrR [Gottschalkiaceae bacterium SANA]
MKTKARLMDDKAMGRAVIRIAHEILEKNHGMEHLVLVGVKTRGVPFAKRIAKKIEEIEGVEVSVEMLDITLYRDDLTEVNEQPTINQAINFDVKGKDVVLFDDVIFTGRTVRAALDALVDHGRPRSIQLAVMIDRGHRELPIRPDYVGKNAPTSRNEIISVKFIESDQEDSVTILEKEK